MYALFAIILIRRYYKNLLLKITYFGLFVFVFYYYYILAYKIR